MKFWALTKQSNNRRKKGEGKKGKKTGNWFLAFGGFLVCALYLLTLHELLLHNSSLDQPFQDMSNRNKKHPERFDRFTVRYCDGSEHVESM